MLQVGTWRHWQRYLRGTNGKEKRNNREETSAIPIRRNYPSKQAINQEKGKRIKHVNRREWQPNGQKITLFPS